MKLLSWFRKSTESLSAAESSDRLHMVLPMISGQAWMDGNKDIFSKYPDFPLENLPIAIPYTNGLFITYALDIGGSWEIVTSSVADSLCGTERLEAVALTNLRQRGDIQIEGSNGRFRLTVPSERDLSASVVLDPNRWRATIPISGDLVVAIPTRAEVLICSTTDKAAISGLSDMAKKCFEAAEAKPVSSSLYRLSGVTMSPLSE